VTMFLQSVIKGRVFLDFFFASEQPTAARLEWQIRRDAWALRTQHVTQQFLDANCPQVIGKE